MQKKIGVRTMKKLVQTALRCWSKFLRSKAFACAGKEDCRDDRDEGLGDQKMRG